MFAKRLGHAWPESRYRARVQDVGVARARAALSRGDVLAAYDEASRAVETHPDDLEARFVAALTLARAGASGGARQAAGDLLRRIDHAGDVPVALREDAEALVARLAKDDALAAAPSERTERTRHAAALYEAVADKYGRSYSCINAATLWLLAGDVDRARDLALRTRELASAGGADAGLDAYWHEATEAEAALILGEADRAHAALTRAAALAGDDLATLAVTRRQLRLVCEVTGTSCDLLDDIAAPLVLHYCGHLIDSARPERFPPELEHHVNNAIREFVERRRVGFGYGSLASGADILVAEALLDHGAQLHVVLPFDAEEFDRVSVAPAGPSWSERFRACLARAASVVHASDSAYMDQDELFGYAGRIAMGHALNRAAFLDAPAEQLAIWDQQQTEGVAGTAHDVAVWRNTGNRSHLIELPAPVQPQSADGARPPANRQIGAILFTDFHGFSRLRDEHFTVFVESVLGALAAVLDEHADALRWCNTWGDAIAAVFADVSAAADCALGLHDAVARLDLAALGLPADLDLRIGAHAGPVLAITDPVGRRLCYWGRELTRAARIEPRTPEGEVYVTDAFAALLALEPRAPFVTEYVGRVTTAKDFETIPMYRLRRGAPRPASSASEPV